MSDDKGCNDKIIEFFDWLKATLKDRSQGQNEFVQAALKDLEKTFSKEFVDHLKESGAVIGGVDIIAFLPEFTTRIRELMGSVCVNHQAMLLPILAPLLDGATSSINGAVTAATDFKQRLEKALKEREEATRGSVKNPHIN